MNALNIHVYLEDNIIKVRFDVITPSFESITELLPQQLHRMLLNKYSSDNFDIFAIRQFFNEIFYYTDQTALENSFKTIVLPTKSFKDEYENTNLNESYNQYSVIYHVSTVPQIALTWLAAVSGYLNIAKNEFNTITFEKAEIADEFKTNKNNSNFLNFLITKENWINRNITSSIMKNLLLLKDQSVLYKNTMEAIEKISKVYTTQPLRELLKINPRMSCINKELVSSYKQTKTSIDKVKMLVSFSQKMIAQDQNRELTCLLEQINYLSKYQLYKLCIGKLSHQGVQEKRPTHYYHWEFSEWNFISFANFQLRSDGRMSITDLSKNPGYLTYYANNRAYNNIFIVEMTFLFKVLGLKFSTDNDFKDEIIFDESSTQKLKDLGVHLNAVYIKKLLYRQNQCSFFNRSKPINEDNYNILNFPLELQDPIIFGHLPDVNVDKKDIDRVEKEVGKLKQYAF